MPDYKQLCAELADSIELLLAMRPVEAKPLRITEDRLARARAALAKPEPEGPTDEELKKLLYFEFTQSTGHGHSEDPIGFARAVLARWGK